MSKQLQWITPTGVIASYAEEGFFEYQLLAKYASKETLYFWDFFNGQNRWREIIVDPDWDYSSLITSLGAVRLNLRGAVRNELELPATGNQVGDGFMLDYDRKIATTELAYKIISGSLGDGLQMYSNGLIQGVPVIEGTPTTATLADFAQKFTVRASDHDGNVSDRTFTLRLSSIANPEIIPKNVTLGTFYDGQYIDLQLIAVDPNPIATISWEVISGQLPGGLELSSNGTISGYIEPFYRKEDEYILGWSIPGWDYVPWDAPVAAAKSKTFRFTVRVFDGSRYDSSLYTINVQAKSLFTVDSTLLSVNNSLFTSDLDDKHSPFITTKPAELGAQRQRSNFAFKFDGRDFDGEAILFGVDYYDDTTFSEGPAGWDELPYVPGEFRPGTGFDVARFDQREQALPPGLFLDPVTGWLTGHIESQIEEEKTYTFQVYCYQKDHPTRRSRPVTFTLTVLGELYNVIDWITPSNLGHIDNGAVSELSIKAVSSKGQKLTYRLREPAADPDSINPADTVITYKSQARSKLPQGLRLLPDGLIVGRTTFEYFSLDQGTTTFDKNTINFDNEYTFTVTAVDDTNPAIYINTGTVSDNKTFTVKVNNYNKLPYENIYLRALPSKEQRLEFSTLIGNTEIFPDQLIYRKSDPWYGKAAEIKFLFAAGMNPNLALTYFESMQQNHYNKRISLGNVKTAVALDENFNVKYEVVYVEVVDQLESDKQSVAKHIGRTNEVKAPYRALPFTQVYPNSLANMKSEVATLGYANRGAMPDWMLNQQEDGRVLGFTRGVVLAYTVPGASKLIAFRLKQYDIQFNVIDFVADRYQVDHLLSKNYDIAAHKFIESAECSFDRLPPVGGLHPYAGSVRYALEIPFDEINNRPLSYVLSRGGLDGSKSIHTGQLVIFAKQELYTPPDDRGYSLDPYDINNFDSVGLDLTNVPYHYLTTNDGWNIETGLWGVKPYASTPYAPSEVIPGYLEHLLYDSEFNQIANQRGGIWRVTINSEQVIVLEFVKEVQLNEYVLVSDGQTHGDTKMYYDPQLKPGHSVPEYSHLTTQVRNSSEFTRFDGGATRFFNNVDVYEEPTTDDMYVKFPKFNIYR